MEYIAVYCDRDNVQQSPAQSHGPLKWVLNRLDEANAESMLGRRELDSTTLPDRNEILAGRVLLEKSHYQKMTN